MTKRTYRHTKSGRPVDDELIEQLAREAEDGYDVDEIVSRRGKRGRPRLGTAPSTVDPSVSTPNSKSGSHAAPKKTALRCPK